MEKDQHCPGVVDFAYEIIALHEENERLFSELEHYKSMYEITCETIKASDNHTKEMAGIIISAALDPNSVINKGHEAIAKDNK